jgi:hypothetical protein
MSGLTLAVKVHPKVEEFFRGISTGEQVDVKGAGRYWIGVDKAAPLMAYSLAENIPLLTVDAKRRARFDWLARQLVTPIGSQPAAEGGELGGGNNKGYDINLSFLRLVGISEGAGITFQLKGVYSDDAVEAMHDHIGVATKAFYQTYMKPVNLAVQIVTTEW